MNTSVPYTRRAIQLIRNGASAADLGWSESMYHSVCASHSLQGVKGARKSVEPVVPPIIVAPKVETDIQFSAAKREIIRASICVAVTRVQTQVFAILFDRHCEGLTDFIASTAIATLIGKDTSPQNILSIVGRLSAKLTPLKIWIETKAGPTGGFRLRVEA